MAFAKDRDLLVLEPGLLDRVWWVGQRLVQGTGTLVGSAISLTEQDVGLDAAGVGIGGVMTVDGVPLEITLVLSASVAGVSRVRASVEGTAIPPGDVTDAAVRVVTFAPQLEDVHRRVLRMVGLDPDGGADEPGEDAITNPGSLARLEALGALHLIYSAAGAGAMGSTERHKAEWYRIRFDEERRAVEARLDLDGDGEAEVARRPSVARLVR